MLKIVITFIFLALLLFFSLNGLQSIEVDANRFLKLSGYFILIFSIFIIVRYFLLLLFSMLNLYKNSKRDKKRISFKNRPLVSIIVPCFNEELMLRASLESLKKLDYPNYEILVIDDGSSDDTFLIAKNMQFEDASKSLKAYTKQNAGKANALNFGIEMANGDYVVCVDADSKLSKNSLDKMIEHFDDDPKIAAVAGSVYVVNSDSFITRLQALEYIQGLNLVRNAQGYYKLVNIIPGPIGMFKKEAIKSIGLYKDDTYAEDCDLTLRLIADGYKIDYEIDAISYTEAPESLNQLLKQRYRWNRGVLQALLKHKRKLIPFTTSFSITFVLWNMLFESILWPVASTFANFSIIFMGILSGYGELFVYWWIIFTVLDLSASIYCVSITKENLKLVLYSFYYRIYFVNVMNIVKVLATIEEFLGIKMNWGALQRKGKL